MSGPSYWQGVDLSQQIDPAVAATHIGNMLNVLGGTAADPIGDFTGGAQAAAPATTTETGTSSGDGSTSAPLASIPTITHGFGGEDHHPGVDLPIPVGTPVLSAVSGKVTQAGLTDPNGYGNLVEVTAADGTVTRYGHLSGIQAQVGATVKAGQQIGLSGGEAGATGSGNSTGPHLHFEVDVNGTPVDPSSYLATGPKIIGAQATDLTATQPVTTQAVTGDQAKDVINDFSSTQKPAATTGSDSTIPAGATGSDTSPGAVDAFLSAIRQHESGGDYTIYNQSGQSNASGAYQFLGSTWQGLGGSTAAAAQASPAEQDAIARRYAMSLFEQFGSWKLVAAAWYGGPGIAQQMAAGKDVGSPEGQGSYAAYANKIASMMGGGGG